MRYLGLALFAEGSTDYRFLPPVLRRATEDLCLRDARSTVEVGEVLGLYTPDDYRDTDLATQILEAAFLPIGRVTFLCILRKYFVSF